MQKIVIVFAVIAAIIACSCHRQTTYESESVNPIIGDLSFVQKFGRQPDAVTDEKLRIQTHFQYVGKLLEKKEIPYLTAGLHQKRTHLLQLLRRYSEAGIFPRNFDYHDRRKPCFIDKENRICAVGYLIEQTAGREVAEQINKTHQYDEILAMNDPMVDSWIENSGLSKEECAMIQPTYGPQPTYSFNHISAGYGISSSILSGINLSANTLNGMQISKGTNKKTVAKLGLLTGTGQTLLGILGFPKDTKNWYNGNTTNESKKTLSIINIGLGTSTMILSAWNLLTNRRPKNKKITWNLKSFQTPDNAMGVAFSIKRKL